MAKKRKSTSRRSTRLRSPRRPTARQASKKNAVAKKSKTPKYVYYFGDGQADGTGKMKPLLGGKGANLAEMTRIGLPVPPGFTITTEVCSHYYANKRRYPAELEAQVRNGVSFLEKTLGKKFG